MGFASVFLRAAAAFMEAAAAYFSMKAKLCIPDRMEDISDDCEKIETEMETLLAAGGHGNLARAERLRESLRRKRRYYAYLSGQNPYGGSGDADSNG